MFAFTNTHTLVSYCPEKNKNVLLMSTLHRDATVRARQDKKPNAILYYNRTKGGVDNLDKFTGTYSCKRMTARWPMVVFFNIIDVSAYNAFVVWWIKAGNGKCYKRQLFLEELRKAMVTPLIQRRQHLPRTPSAAALVRDVEASEARATREGTHKRKRCKLCTKRCQNQPCVPQMYLFVSKCIYLVIYLQGTRHNHNTLPNMCMKTQITM